VVDGADILHRDDVRLGHMAEAADLARDAILQRQPAPGADEVWRQAESSQLPHSMLRRFGLLLAGGGWLRDKADLDENKIRLADAKLELAESLDKGHALNVADGPSQLDDANIGLLAVDVLVCDALHPLLDAVCDVRHNWRERGGSEEKMRRAPEDGSGERRVGVIVRGARDRRSARIKNKIGGGACSRRIVRGGG